MSILSAGVSRGSRASTPRGTAGVIRAAMRSDASRARATVLTGDVHGHSKKLRHLFQRLHSALGSERLSEARVVFLGDLCYRGPDTKGVLEFIASELPEKYPAIELRVLAGNHDLAHLHFS